MIMVVRDIRMVISDVRWLIKRRFVLSILSYLTIGLKI
jgi:hypothetical protein